MFCWGWNKYGQVSNNAYLINDDCIRSKNLVLIVNIQLGLGDAIDRNIPAIVQMETCCAINISCGWWHTSVLAESPT